MQWLKIEENTGLFCVEVVVVLSDASGVFWSRQGSSLVICVGILTSYTDTLYKMLSQLSGRGLSCWPYALGLLGIFTAVTMWAVVVTEGCRKIKLQYYGFKLASNARNGSPVTEVEPYIPFNINPSGMQPVLTTSYLLAFPGILARAPNGHRPQSADRGHTTGNHTLGQVSYCEYEAEFTGEREYEAAALTCKVFCSLLGSRFWEHVKEILNPESSIGPAPWVYYAIYAFFVFVFNIFDIVSKLYFSVTYETANMPKEIAEYLNKMGARIPNIKPGKGTIEYLTRIQASTRFWGMLPRLLFNCLLFILSLDVSSRLSFAHECDAGGLLLCILATSSSMLDHYLRRINENFAIGFTSVLIIVSMMLIMFGLFSLTVPCYSTIWKEQLLHALGRGSGADSMDARVVRQAAGK
ncbi:hypothetical protein Cgig2_022689 [Carnegiea gigantea]|uniref:Uncharacterized protein n=1 Tax=Carnegiea gigantea TaxID=171969 RepID=A0A9Q1GMN6_9CARY|nr:hypothetical protein Cgig2_022689 [Carnegiea gigantea]